MFDWLCGLLLPARCVLCDRPGQLPCLDLCRDCAADLPVLPATCQHCALPLPAQAQPGLTCSACRGDPPAYDRCHAAFEYAFPVDHLVHGLKYRARLATGRVLGQLLGASLEARGLHLDVDMIVPVPLYPARHAARGYNQSAEIARWVARTLVLPCREREVRRRRDTPAQVGLAVAERRANLADAFACSPSMQGLRVAVVDDVLTTGSTAQAMARALRSVGAVSVDVWCVARALPPG